MIRIEVTGDNAAEVLTQLRGLVLSSADARAIASAEVNRADDAAREAMQAARTSAVEAQRGSTAEEAAAPADAKPKRKNVSKEQADATTEIDDLKAVGNAPSASNVENSSPVSSGEPDTKTVENAPSPSELNFDTDVAPVVLRVVQSKGKPAVEAVLEEFGVARASQLESSRWQELIDKLEEVG